MLVETKHFVSILLFTKEDDIIVAHLPVVGDDGSVNIYGADYARPFWEVAEILLVGYFASNLCAGINEPAKAETLMIQLSRV